MSVAGDNEDVRTEQLLAGGPVPPADESLAAVLGQLRRLADEAAPQPSPALSALLRDGIPAAALPARPEAVPARWPLSAVRWAAGLGLAAKILLGAGVAAAATAGAATIPGVPDAVQQPIRDAFSHLISGTADLPVPVPSTTPEPVRGVVPGDGRSAEPGHSNGSDGRGRPADPPAGDPAPGRGDENGRGHSDGPPAERPAHPSNPAGPPEHAGSHGNGPASPPASGGDASNTGVPPAGDRGQGSQDGAAAGQDDAHGTGRSAGAGRLRAS